MTVHGQLDGQPTAQLDLVLADLIGGRGNLSIIVDLRDVKATATDADRASLFANAAGRAPPHRGLITLNKPLALLHEALLQRGLSHRVGALTPAPEL